LILASRPIKTEIIRQQLIAHHERSTQSVHESIGIEAYAKTQLHSITALYQETGLGHE